MADFNYIDLGLRDYKECWDYQEKSFAEIVAATVVCGEVSLASAVMAGEWVSAHDKYGRNR